MEFRKGELIDYQYLVQQIIRTGGMGILYIVRDSFSDRQCAVKSVKEELLEKGEAVRRFEREAKVWLNLGSHENVVQALFYREVCHTPLLFMEYVDGPDLGTIVAKAHALPLPQVIDFGLQICRGMIYAIKQARRFSDEGLVHRDLKPRNILVARDRKAKITDFGLVKVSGDFTRLTADRGGIGTIPYMPPEQIRRAAAVDVRTDIYSLAVVLYQIAAGRRPFVGNTATDVIRQIEEQDPQPPSSLNERLPKDFDDLVLACLSKAPDDRPESFERVQEQLAAIQIAPSVLTGTETECAACGMVLLPSEDPCCLCGGATQRPYQPTEGMARVEPPGSVEDTARLSTTGIEAKRCGCGAELRQTQRFCVVCGASADRVAPAPARREPCSCGAALEPGQKFCRKCGKTRASALTMPCACGEQNPVSKQFCVRCGRQLATVTC